MAHSYVMLVVHIVFSTKGRVPFIGAEHRDRLYAYMGGIIRNERSLLLEIGGMPDHVHLLARFRASVSLSEMLKLIKGRSSHWMNGLPNLGYHFDWQEGYAAFSVSESQIATVRKYIQTQEQLCTPHLSRGARGPPAQAPSRIQRGRPPQLKRNRSAVP